MSGCKTYEPRVESVKANGIVLVTVDGWWDPTAGVDPFTPESLPGATRFADAMTPCPQVRPAVVSILTGQTPDRTGIRDDLTQPLPPEVPYLPELIAKKGSQTAAFVASPHVGHGSGLERGFAIFDAPREMIFGPFRFNPKLRPADELIKNFSTWSNGLAADRPFFAWIHLAFGGPATRVPGPTAPSAEAAWKSLAAVLSEEGRLRDAAVFVIGISGNIDLGSAAKSGYFLVPSVLRVPMLIRPAKGRGGRVGDATAPRMATDLAAAIGGEAGVTATFPDAVSPAAPPPGITPRVRFAWTWRGAREFDWPVQGAAVRDDVLLVSEGAGAPSSVVSWSTGAATSATSATGLAEALLARTPWVEDRTQVGPALPPELAGALAKSRVSIPAARKLPPQPNLQVRMEQIPILLRARADAQNGLPEPAVASFDLVVSRDPGNSGARVEAGQILALTQGHAKARQRLEAALDLYPYRAEAWHWLSHVALDQKEIPKADAMLLLSNFLDPYNADVLYDLACSRSLLADPEGAEGYLRKAWSAGYRDADHIEADTDLRNLRADPRYARFMQEVGR
jgi:hypothetical protein